MLQAVVSFDLIHHFLVWFQQCDKSLTKTKTTAATKLSPHYLAGNISEKNVDQNWELYNEKQKINLHTCMQAPTPTVVQERGGGGGGDGAPFDFIYIKAQQKKFKLGMKPLDCSTRRHNFQ